LPQRIQRLGDALLHAHRLHRHGLRVEAEFGHHRCVGRRCGEHRNVDALRLELVVERFTETVDLSLPTTIIRHERNADFGAHRPDQDQPAPPTLSEFPAEMVGDVQMCHGVEPEGRLK
jgi:hypothetical protein